MKKIALSLFVLSSATFANASPIDQVNKTIKEMLQPIQNEYTVAKLTFDDIKLSSTKTDNVALHANYLKHGQFNQLGLKINNLSYENTDGQKPTTHFDASIKYDLTKILPANDLDEIFDNLSPFINGMFDFYTEGKYGESATLNTEVSSASKDKNGHYTEIKGNLSLSIDLSKLPEMTPVDEIEVLQVVFSFSLKANEGFAIHGFVYSNPEYSGFEDSEQGLKDYLQSLLDHDESTINDIVQQVKSLDELADSFVNGLHKFQTSPPKGVEPK